MRASTPRVAPGQVWTSYREHEPPRKLLVRRLAMHRGRLRVVLVNLATLRQSYADPVRMRRAKYRWIPPAAEVLFS